VPDGAFVPKSLEQFRLWTDKELELAQIGSKSTLYQPWNRELRTEIVRLIKLLRSRRKTPKNGTSALDRLRAGYSEIKFTLKQLAGEVHQIRQELQFERRESERKDHRIADLKEENAKLTAQLRQHAGLYPVK
jgi:chromosome segregation ATPase